MIYGTMAEKHSEKHGKTKVSFWRPWTAGQSAVCSVLIGGISKVQLPYFVENDGVGSIQIFKYENAGREGDREMINLEQLTIDTRHMKATT
jgi:hypothetical protein